jgi:hypothetical protein
MFAWLMLGATSLVAQNQTKSPYTRYGYGKLADPSVVSLKGMGGIGYGVRNSQMINTLNPAAYSAVDSMTFMLDIGVNMTVGNYKDGALSASKTTAGLDYLAIQFPLLRGLGMGVGLEPVSYVGYKYGQDAKVVQDEETVTGYETYSGTGGLNKISSSLSYRIVKPLSLGVKVSYLFGTVAHGYVFTPAQTNDYSLTWSETLQASGFTYDFGLQYTQALSKTKSLTLGLVYIPKTNFGGDYTDVKPSGTTSIDTTFNYKGSLPETYGIGLTYNLRNRLTLGADVQYQRWGEVEFNDFGDNNGLTDRLKINAGVEYIPNVLSRSFGDRLRYRAGVSYANSYIIDSNLSKYSEYGIYIGFGIPMVDRRSFVNISMEYSRLTPQKTLSMNESFFKFTLGYTFNESWFRKRKLQ